MQCTDGSIYPTHLEDVLAAVRAGLHHGEGRVAGLGQRARNLRDGAEERERDGGGGHDLAHRVELQALGGVGLVGEERQALELNQAMVQRVGDRVRRPARDHDGGHEGQQEVRLVGELDHDHRQAHGQPRQAGEEGRRPDQREHAGVDPVDVRAGVHAARDVGHDEAEEPPQRRADQEGGDHDACGAVVVGAAMGDVRGIHTYTRSRFEASVDAPLACAMPAV